MTLYDHLLKMRRHVDSDLSIQERRAIGKLVLLFRPEKASASVVAKYGGLHHIEQLRATIATLPDLLNALELRQIYIKGLSERGCDCAIDAIRRYLQDNPEYASGTTDVVDFDLLADLQRRVEKLEQQLADMTADS